MNTSGWVKDFRKLKTWRWYKTSNMHHVFSHLLMSVSPFEYKYNGTMHEAGTMMTCSKELADELGLEWKTVIVCLKRMKSTGEIDFPEPLPHTKRWLLKINKWSYYQSGEDVQEPPQEVIQKTDNQRQEVIQKTDNPTLLYKENLNTREFRSRERADAPTTKNLDSDSSLPAPPVPAPQANFVAVATSQMMAYPQIDDKGIKLVMDTAVLRAQFRMTEDQAKMFLAYYWKIGWMSHNHAINWQYALVEWCAREKTKKQGDQNGYRFGTNARDTGAVGTEADFANDPYFTPADQAFK